MRRPVTPLVLALLTWLALPGCSGDGPAPPELLDAPEPIIHGEVRGLELHVWPTGDDAETVTALLDDLARPDESPWLEEDARERWERAGFRFLELPASGFGTLEQDFPPIIAVTRRHVRPTLRWEQLYRAEPLENGSAVVTGTGYTRLDAGTPRLVGRSWISVHPAVGGGIESAVRLQLIAQLEDPPVDDPFAQGSRETTIPDLTEQGRMLEGLSLTAQLRPDRMYVISSSRGAGPAEDSAEASGPSVAPTPTLAQRMLSGQATQLNDLAWRGIIVLIPRTERRFSLIDQ